jgi:hypothetical protein
MNRQSKEEAKKHAAARVGLSAEEIAELDARDAAEQVLLQKARALHAALFPEELDHFYDDAWDAALRRRGISPMKDSYIAKTNVRRAALGFAAEGHDGRNQQTDTLSWVTQKLRSGKGAELDAILRERDAEDSACESAAPRSDRAAEF